MKTRRKLERSRAITPRTAARRYARALFDVAFKEQADLSQIDRELAAFRDVIREHLALAKALLNPAVPTPRKQAAVGQIATLMKASPIVTRLLDLLANRDRLVLMDDLLAAYRDRVLDHQQVVRAEVATAQALTPDRRQAIADSLARATGRTVSLTTRVDPGLVGGLVAKVGSVVYDGSVTMQLRKIRERLLEAGA